MTISKTEGLRLVIEHLCRDLDIASLIVGWPEGSYRFSGEPVWHIAIRGSAIGVGSSRVIVISQATGKILADTRFGE